MQFTTPWGVATNTSPDYKIGLAHGLLASNHTNMGSGNLNGGAGTSSGGLYTVHPNGVGIVTRSYGALATGYNSSGGYPFFSLSTYSSFWEDLFNSCFFSAVRTYTDTSATGDTYVTTEASYGVGGVLLLARTRYLNDTAYPTFSDDYKTRLIVMQGETKHWEATINACFAVDGQWMVGARTWGNETYNLTTMEPLTLDRPLQLIYFYPGSSMGTSYIFGIIQGQIAKYPSGYLHAKVADPTLPARKRFTTSSSTTIARLADLSLLTPLQQEISGYGPLVQDKREYPGMYQTDVYLDAACNLFRGVGNPTDNKLVIPHFRGESLVDVYDILSPV